jgi:hypothetical protein
MLLTDKLIERSRPHPGRQRRIIGTLDFDVFVIPEKILHEGNYGAPVTQAIVSAIRTDLFRGEPAGLNEKTRLFRSQRHTQP